MQAVRKSVFHSHGACGCHGSLPFVWERRERNTACLTQAWCRASSPIRAQRQGKPGVARDGRLVRGRQGEIRLQVPPTQRHRVSLCRTQEDVRGLHTVPQARQQGKGDLDPCHMLQHRARGQVTGKRRQAHTGPNRNTRSVTGVFNTAPFLAEPPHHALDLEDFMGCGGTWRNMGCHWQAPMHVMPLSPWHRGWRFFITRTHPPSAKR